MELQSYFAILNAVNRMIANGAKLRRQNLQSTIGLFNSCLLGDIVICAAPNLLKHVNYLRIHTFHMLLQFDK